ncbi:MAG TPA: hypothetical protein VMW65_04460 [Chloroflexota bacterium]|nr:hypothetical protein [Chloroflexota bacterium]
MSFLKFRHQSPMFQALAILLMAISTVGAALPANAFASQTISSVSSPVATSAQSDPSSTLTGPSLPLGQSAPIVGPVPQLSQSNPSAAVVGPSMVPGAVVPAATPTVQANTLLGSASGNVPANASVSFGDPGTLGFDISYPQCQTMTSPFAPTNLSYQFAVLGVTGGRAMTQNRCLGEELQIAAQQKLSPSFYLNVNYPRSAALSDAASGPLGTCDTTDSQCLSYTYGWNTAQNAYRYAQQTVQDLNVTSVPSVWWLDVEIANYWSRDPSLNDRVIQGAIDFFGWNVSNATVGIYSIRSNWNQIAGSDFQPSVPTWVAGAHSLAGASFLCSQSSFTGGPVALVQYATKQFDVDYVC